MLSLAERCAVGRATGLMLAVASGSGGPSAEPAPETEVKGSGERPLAEAAALEIEPERLTESHHHSLQPLSKIPGRVALGLGPLVTEEGYTWAAGEACHAGAAATQERPRRSCDPK